MAPKKMKTSDEVAPSPKYDGEHVVATDDQEQVVGIFNRAGEGYGTIRYPNGRMVRKPIALIHLAEHPLVSVDTSSEDVDVVTGDLVYSVNDAERIIGVFYAASQPGYAKIHYPGNRFEQITLDDVRAARLAAEAQDEHSMFPRDADSSGNGIPDDEGFDDALDKAADRVLHETGEPDLDADAALTDEELMALAEEDDVVIEDEADAGLNDADLPPIDEEELPPGEEQPLPKDIQTGDLVEEARKPLTPEQFGSDDDSDLYAVAVRLQNAGLLTGATRLHKALPGAMPHDVTITCADEEEYDLILAAMPKHLAIVAADQQTRTLIVHEVWLDEAPQFGASNDQNLLYIATRLHNAGLLSYVTRLSKSSAFGPSTVDITCKDRDAYGLLLRAMPEDLIKVARYPELLEIIVRKDPFFTPMSDLLSDDESQVALLQKQLAEATAEVNRLRDEVSHLRALAEDNAEAEAAMDAARRNIHSMTLIFSDIEKTTGDRKIAELIAAGWWLVPHSEHFLVRRNAFGTEVIAHALRFEYIVAAPEPVQRIAEDMLLAMDMPLVEDEPTEGLVVPVSVENGVPS